MTMSQQEYFNFHKQCTDKMFSICKRKNTDYAGGGEDAFANFTRVESMGIASTEQGFLTRMSDKLSRLSSFCQNGDLQVKDESVEDTLLDLANYCLLMAGYLASKPKTEKHATKEAVDSTIKRMTDLPRSEKDEPLRIIDVRQSRVKKYCKVCNALTRRQVVIGSETVYTCSSTCDRRILDCGHNGLQG